MTTSATDLKPAVFGIISKATGIPLESINEETKIPVEKTKDVLDALAQSYRFCIQYTEHYTAGQILKVVFT